MQAMLTEGFLFISLVENVVVVNVVSSRLLTMIQLHLTRFMNTEIVVF